MIDFLCLIGTIFVTYGIISNVINLQIIFAVSIIIFLYIFIMACKQDGLSEYGTTLLVVNFVVIAYCVCELFLGINIRVLFGIERGI